jgi:DNA-binding winged helix-turn-helix (wHTH) protein/TolB-like protein
MGRTRFGVFELDEESGALWRDGRKVRLQAQPAKALAALIAARGEVVSRETLQQVLWGNETFVDFERGLNFCIAQVRAALGDSAESPRYILTVPRRGYQFIAPMQAVAAGPPPKPSPPWRRIAMGAAALLAASALLLAWRAAEEPPTLAVARFDNETGDPKLDRFADAVTDLLVAKLAISHDVRVIGNAAILRGPRAERDLRAIADELGVQFIVLGQVQGAEPSVRVIAHLIQMPQQTHITALRFERDFAGMTDAEEWLASEIASELGPYLD